MILDFTGVVVKNSQRRILLQLGISTAPQINSQQLRTLLSLIKEQSYL